MTDLRTVADQLVSACREGREAEALKTLYAADATSVEAADMGQGREAVGVEAIQAKHDWWNSTTEVTGGSVSDPMLHGEDRFAVIFEVEGTDKASGTSFDMREVAIYTVADGKIVREEFFYAPMG